ncbi:hypothetical protein F7731_09205 [Cytobacillus depressus]|uniref:YwpF-like family protein n=1 Tax=Cytobacillus depressus TaxID=1602942 RepID=A0A6L3VBF8_9BACI|nr:YwpF-like family protein [Cytobacillus depressus]KAB2336543.1 hypothetical protein F7731_09205 [Cytobacillus depressus]
MKTFKLISLQVVEDDSLVEIDLNDGLIINQENERNTWLLEFYINKSYDDYFQKLFKEGKELIVQVVITKKENSPAALQSRIITIKHLKDHMSILMEGKLMKNNDDYAEVVLKKLIDKGLAGEELMKEFKTILRGKPHLTAAKKE